MARRMISLTGRPVLSLACLSRSSISCGKKKLVRFMCFTIAHNIDKENTRYILALNDEILRLYQDKKTGMRISRIPACKLSYELQTNCRHYTSAYTAYI